MTRLIVVAGASGAGKSFLLQTIARLYPTMEVVRKLTTRLARSYESNAAREHLDLELERPLSDVQGCPFRYAYGNEFYGIRPEDIDRVIARGHHPIVIVRNCLTIERLVLSYPDALVLYLQSGLSGDDLMAKLQSQHRDDIEISERMRRLQADFADYCKHIHLFHRVLINYYEPDSLIAQMESILQHELDQRTLNAPSPIANKVFVLMSFSQAQNKVYRAMKAAGRLVDIPGGLRVERIDSRTGDYKITSEILRSIREAALLVCDLSEERPNVYYELGYARGRGKTVLHCAVSDTKLHFDVREFRTIFYDDPLDLQEKLEIEFRNHFLGSLSRDEKSYV